jgi:hypothetical protein
MIALLKSVHDGEEVQPINRTTSLHEQPTTLSLGPNERPDILSKYSFGD